MRKQSFILVAALVVIGFGVLWALSQPVGAPSNSLNQGAETAAERSGAEKTDSGAGNVTVSASWKELEDELRFEVALNTHSVSLDDFDPKTQIVLEATDDSVVRPTTIIPEGEGHHRSYTVSFEKSKGEGEKFKNGGAIRLVVTNLAGAARRELVW